MDLIHVHGQHLPVYVFAFWGETEMLPLALRDPNMRLTKEYDSHELRS
jgi:hypothetical protein